MDQKQTERILINLRKLIMGSKAPASTMLILFLQYKTSVTFVYKTC